MNDDHQKILDHIDNMLMTRTNLAVDDVVNLKIRVKDALEASEARARHLEELLAAWFDRRKLAHERIDQAVYDATKSYLRRSANGGMDAGDVGMVLGIIEDMTRLSVFADLFARATLDQDEK